MSTIFRPHSDQCGLSRGHHGETVEDPHTLALVVPDHRANMHVPLLIGTNTSDPLYEKFASIQDKNEKHQTKNGHCPPLVRNLYNIFKVNQQNGL